MPKYIWIFACADFQSFKYIHIFIWWCFSFLNILKYLFQPFFRYLLIPDTHKHKKHTHSLYHYNKLNVGIWLVLMIQVYCLFKMGWVVYIIFLTPSHTVNMTFPPSLLANGCQPGSSELVISHCPLCPVKLSTEFFMVSISMMRTEVE